MSFPAKFLNNLTSVARAIDSEALEKMALTIAALKKAGGRLFLIGSGGGAGHASHACCDFRKLGGIDAICPTDNVSELTARTNDDGWENSISGSLIASRINERDALFVFSVGGGSREKNVSVNLVNAVDVAKAHGARVLGVVGRDGGHVARNADACLVVPDLFPELVTPLTESFQAVVWHLLVSHPALTPNEGKWESIR